MNRTSATHKTGRSFEAFWHQAKADADGGIVLFEIVPEEMFVAYYADAEVIGEALGVVAFIADGQNRQELVLHGELIERSLRIVRSAGHMDIWVSRCGKVSRIDGIGELTEFAGLHQSALGDNEPESPKTKNHRRKAKIHSPKGHKI